MFALLLTFVLSPDEAQASVRSNYNKTMGTIDWIYAKKHSRRPTNRTGWFYGDKLTFWHKTRNPTNGADRSFGYFLYYTYDMYCLKKFKRKNCLGKRLVVHYKISGKTKRGRKVMQISTRGQKSITSNYFQGVMAQFFNRLENIGGRAPLSHSERRLIQPAARASVLANFKVLTPTRGRNANAKWKDRKFVQNVMNSARSSLFNLVPFKTNRIERVVNQRDYDNKSQGSILRKYDRSAKSPQSIGAVISGPATTDSAGRAFVTRSSQPSFVMRSRYNSPNNERSARAIKNNALIYIHELAHNMMKLRHCSRGQKSLCTDNLWHNRKNANEVLKTLRSRNIIRYNHGYKI